MFFPLVPTASCIRLAVPEHLAMSIAEELILEDDMYTG